MDRDEALKLLRGGEDGIKEWNRWRVEGEKIPELYAADLSDANLSDANLIRAKLIRAILSAAHLTANLSGAILNDADLSNAKVGWTTFADVNLTSTKGLDSLPVSGRSAGRAKGGFPGTISVRRHTKNSVEH